MPWSVEDVDKHKKGLSDKQKKQWIRIANSVRSRELAKGKSEGEADASAIRQANGVVGTNKVSGLYSVYKTKQTLDYEPKLTIHQDKAHLVIPVVMMVEGVHNGSQGPLLHEIAELGKFPASWNGRPVVIYHPEVDGEPVSANSPEIIDTRTVGRVYNTNVDGKKLSAEIWLDEDKLNSISEDTLNEINASKEMEVSLGMFTENEMIPGKYGEEEYAGIAHNHRPDHLAILPDQVGACSNEDGCGIGANSKNKPVVKGYSLSIIGNNKEEGYKERLDAAYNALRELDSSESHYLEELWDTELIFSKYTKEGVKMYRQGYKFESGKIELIGDPVEVHKQVEFVVNSNVKFKKEDKKMSDNKCPKCVEKINALIANKASGFVEADREWLDTLTEAALDKIAPKVIEKIVDKIVEKTVEVNKLTPEQTADLAFLANQRAAKRTEMIQGIQTNTSKELWPDDILKVMNEDNLKRIFDSVKKVEAPADYSLNGNTFVAGANAEEPLYATGVVVDEIKK
jgi:hypothetical protein